MQRQLHLPIAALRVGVEQRHLEFDAGKVTALVGASGCGESTIVELIEQWYDPTMISVHVGGHAVVHLDLHWLRRQVGLVQQDPVLFSDTIYHNVVHGLYGTPMNDLPELEKRKLVRQACVQAFADVFIQELPHKYDTKVGDRGALLSGGQKQRIAITRCIISIPVIFPWMRQLRLWTPRGEKGASSLDKLRSRRPLSLLPMKISTVRRPER